MRKLTIIALLVFILPGCASSGTQIDTSEVNNIKPGVTSEQNLIQHFGQPLSQSYTSEGKRIEIWQYTHIGPFGIGSKNQNLSVLFNQDGTVEKYNLINGGGINARIGY